MSVTVVIGGQYGSEGKGKVCAHLALAGEADLMVRCGGPNSGHTVDMNGVVYELKQVPAGFVNPSTRLLLAPGALVKPALFLQEVSTCGLSPDRIGIDRNAAVIETSDVDAETTSGMRERFGSTGVGMGSAVSRRVLRGADVRLVGDVSELRPYITCVDEELAAAEKTRTKIVVEGTQGYGLSLYHTEKWPFCTGRDTTAHSFLSEVGLGTRNYDVVMALRTYPIRVGGNSGPLADEITWEEVQRRSGYPHVISEYTTTTKRLRRVARFDWSVVERAVVANAPTHIALHGLDYLDYRNKGVEQFENLTTGAQEFVRSLEARIGIPVSFLGTGPATGDLIDVRRSRSNVFEMRQRAV